MTSKPILRGIGLATAAALLASGLALQPVTAQDSKDKSKPRTEKSEKQKSTGKKTTQSQTTPSGGGTAAPMSGFRPDPLTNY
jgi:hypothetical protein